MSLQNPYKVDCKPEGLTPSIIKENKMASERITIALACTECKNKNYYQVRGKKKEYKLELNKFCKKCGKSTKHKESKA